jgi:bifunctional non-homologous end joining protein LigD
VAKKRALPKQAAGFIETMDRLPVAKLPEGLEWIYEIKLDGYRLEVVRSGRDTTLYSRRQNICPDGREEDHPKWPRLPGWSWC